MSQKDQILPLLEDFNDKLYKDSNATFKEEYGQKNNEEIYLEYFKVKLTIGEIKLFQQINVCSLNTIVILINYIIACYYKEKTNKLFFCLVNVEYFQEGKKYYKHYDEQNQLFSQEKFFYYSQHQYIILFYNLKKKWVLLILNTTDKKGLFIDFQDEESQNLDLLFEIIEKQLLEQFKLQFNQFSIDAQLMKVQDESDAGYLLINAIFKFITTNFQLTSLKFKKSEKEILRPRLLWIIYSIKQLSIKKEEALSEYEEEGEEWEEDEYEYEEENLPEEPELKKKTSDIKNISQDNVKETAAQLNKSRENSIKSNKEQKNDSQLEQIQVKDQDIQKQQVINNTDKIIKQTQDEKIQEDQASEYEEEEELQSQQSQNSQKSKLNSIIINKNEKEQLQKSKQKQLLSIENLYDQKPINYVFSLLASKDKRLVPVDSNVVSERYGISIYQKQIKLLLEQFIIDQPLLDYYISYINEKYLSQLALCKIVNRERNQQTVIFPIQFIQTILLRKEQQKQQGKKKKQKVNTLQDLLDQYTNGRNLLEDFNYVYFPVLYQDGEFALFIINYISKTINCQQFLSQKVSKNNKSHKEILEEIVKFIKSQERRNADLIKIVYTDNNTKKEKKEKFNYKFLHNYSFQLYQMDVVENICLTGIYLIYVFSQVIQGNYNDYQQLNIGHFKYLSKTFAQMIQYIGVTNNNQGEINYLLLQFEL